MYSSMCSISTAALESISFYLKGGQCRGLKNGTDFLLTPLHPTLCSLQKITSK